MPDSNLPTVCVIIPTMQRRGFLEETLSYLAKSDYPHDRMEVFVVDGGSTDGSEEAVGQYDSSSEIRFRWHSDPSLRVSAARNYAIHNTDADCLVFVDDDCITTPGWIAALVGPLRSGEADIAAGTDEAPADDPFLARCEDVAFRSVVCSGGVRGTSGRAVTEFCPMTCNMAMSREKMIAAGGFDETMKAVEDTDFVYKAKRKGLKVKFIPEATLMHRRRASIRSICYHNYIRGYGRLLLWKRYREQKQGAFFLPAIGLVVAGLLAAAGFLSYWAWIALALGGLSYLMLLLFAGVEGMRKLKRPRAGVVVPFLVAIHHLWYALGTIHGPLTRYRGLSARTEGSVADPYGTRRKAEEQQKIPDPEEG